MFSEREQARYERHFTLPGFGVEGQVALAESSVLCVGVGGLGSPAALYLAAAGVGAILALLSRLVSIIAELIAFAIGSSIYATLSLEEE